jgi:hypothetical protein
MPVLRRNCNDRRGHSRPVDPPPALAGCPLRPESDLTNQDVIRRLVAALLTMSIAAPMQDAAAQDPVGGVILGGAAGAILGGAFE